MVAKRKTAVDFWTDLGVSLGRANECWPWPGRADKDGYGTMNRVVDGVRYQRAHRLAYRYGHGPIPVGMVVMHTCDNPPCCNPAHLRLGTIADNNADMLAKDRQRYPSGAEHHSYRRPDVVPRGSRHYTHQRPEAMAALVSRAKAKAKVTDEQVAEMRALYASGGWTFDQLSERYGISKGHAHAVVRGRFRASA